jgi:hypothetical protein
MRHDLLQGAVSFTCFLVSWGALFAVPHAFLVSGHFWWALFAAYGSILLLEYEYHGAVGFVMLPGCLSIWLLASSGSVFVGSVAPLLREYGLDWASAAACAIAATFAGGYALVKVDPWLKWLYIRLHEEPNMASVLDRYVGCNHCTGECSVQDAFDVAFKSWPQQSWIAFRCPTCKQANHLRVEEGIVTEGYLDGAPAPCFIIKRAVRIPGLAVSLHSDGITIRNLNLKWWIPSSDVNDRP